MKTIPVAALRQNPTQALAEVEQGETYIVTRHNREIARLVPPEPAATVTPEQFRALLRATPLTRDWAAELKESASDFDGDDPWSKTS
jgi:prevent-host-death family protein